MRKQFSPTISCQCHLIGLLREQSLGIEKNRISLQQKFHGRCFSNIGHKSVIKLVHLTEKEIRNIIITIGPNEPKENTTTIPIWNYQFVSRAPLLFTARHFQDVLTSSIVHAMFKMWKDSVTAVYKIIIEPEWCTRDSNPFEWNARQIVFYSRLAHAQNVTRSFFVFFSNMWLITIKK